MSTHSIALRLEVWTPGATLREAAFGVYKPGNPSNALARLQKQSPPARAKFRASMALYGQAIMDDWYEARLQNSSEM